MSSVSGHVQSIVLFAAAVEGVALARFDRARSVSLCGADDSLKLGFSAPFLLYARAPVDSAHMPGARSAG